METAERWIERTRTLLFPQIYTARGNNNFCSEFCWKGQEWWHWNLSSTTTAALGRWRSRHWNVMFWLTQKQPWVAAWPVRFMSFLSSLFFPLQILVKKIILNIYTQEVARVDSLQATETSLPEAFWRAFKDRTVSPLHIPFAVRATVACCTLHSQAHTEEQIPENTISSLTEVTWWLPKCVSKDPSAFIGIPWV